MPFINVIYWIVLGCFANRLKLFIDKSTEVKLISEYIEWVFDILNYTKRKNIPGLLSIILINFEKASILVLQEFAFHTLDLLNFGKYMIASEFKLL